MSIYTSGRSLTLRRFVTTSARPTSGQINALARNAPTVWLYMAYVHPCHRTGRGLLGLAPINLMAGEFQHTFVEPPSKDPRWKCHISQGINIMRWPVLETFAVANSATNASARVARQGKLPMPVAP